MNLFWSIGDNWKTQVNKKRYDSELPYQRPDLIEVMEIEIALTTY